MVDYRHWALAYLMYMLPPLVIMYPLFIVLDPLLGGQMSLTHMGFLYILSTGVVLLYRIGASHAHHELWREVGAAVSAAALFFVITPLWALVGVASGAYLVYHRMSGKKRVPQQRQMPQSRPQQPQQRER